MKTTKAFLLGGIAFFVLAWTVCAQTPSPVSPSATPLENTIPSATVAPASSPALSAAATVSPTATNQLAEKIKEKVDRKFKHKGFDITIDGDDNDEHGSVHGGGDIPEGVFPIVAMGILGIFGFPVAIVAIIVLSSWAKSRSLQRTVRMMVEKGQPVPPELFASPSGSAIRPWYDLRRGIILLAVGIAFINFFGITAGWDEGVWALGLIPGLIGLGYILVWRLANRHGNGFKQ
jgi:Domain of unknown function (DUF6249)